MRNAPSYEAERFPADFAVSATVAIVVAGLAGPFAWWLARRYFLLHHPSYPDRKAAAITAGALDGALLAIGAFVLCFAVRIWKYERRERRRSDALLQSELNQDKP